MISQPFWLKKPVFEGISQQELAQQILSKKKCEKKLPTWFETPRIYYPPTLSIEQTSSELTALYKATLVQGSLIDITGGFGVDCYYFSQVCNTVTHCEINEELSEIAAYNSKLLNTKNISFITNDGISYISSSNAFFQWIYVDPSRRHDSKGKVFLLSDCIPNVVEHLQTLFAHSHNILIKTSPLLDIQNGLKELTHVKEIHIVAVQNETKEMLWVLKKNTNNTGQLQVVHSANQDSSTIIKAVNLLPNNEESTFSFTLEEEQNGQATYDAPKNFLYEPNSALLKAGAFQTISKRFKIDKLHKHSHLYTSEKRIDFPGRVFRIVEVMPFNKKNVKKQLQNTKAHITTRNFPDSADSLRKNYKIKDGGDLFLFFTTNLKDEKIIIICTK